MRNNKKWGGRDRRFFAETVYDCVRWWRLYWHLLNKKENPEILALVAVSLWHRGFPVPEIEEFASLKPDNWEKRKNEISDVSIKESVTPWLYKLGKEDMGDDWDQILESLNKPNQLILRANTQKTTPEKIIQELKKKEIIAERLQGTQEGLIIEKRTNIFQTEIFKKGWFEVQDGSSQQVAHYLDVEPGMRVIDACAGAGGKTLHIADLLKNKGKVVSMDIHQWKLDQLKLRARRNSYSNIELKLIEGSKTIKRSKETADRLLLDVPCTGLGVLRRNPDTKWKLNDKSLNELLNLQQEILQSYSRMLKPGGKMVYATCSLLHAENEKQVEKFLGQNEQFKILKQERILPHKPGFDGFFMALIEKS
ncbi:MAG: methyltransferase domain-containing protein [Bdellovibrionales bacterium]|nr:methyltransferase domain-containing protein [Bdellovibrionales bacterium]